MTTLLATFSLSAVLVGIQVQDVEDGVRSADEATGMMCGRCGDGYCVKQCGENALTCPQDCLGSSS